MKRIPTGYSLHECPPAKETALLSIQQIIVAVFNVIPVPLLIGAGIGLSASEITLLVAGCLLAACSLSLTAQDGIRRALEEIERNSTALRSMKKSTWII